MMLDQKDKLIVSQTAYKCASWLHAAEVSSGASPDTDHLFNLARTIANGMIKLSGSPSAGQAGGPTPQQGPRAGENPSHSPAPSCPRCNEPMEPNKNWTGLGNQEGHKKSESIKYRCSQRGRFVPDKGWSGCDGVKWEDAA